MFGMLWWLIGVAGAVWVIYDIVTYQKKMKSEHKLLWIIAAVVFSVLTAIIYYFVVKRK
ncbi:MAG: PLDc N-terminal domain-containing protein [Nanoarchaeota archaeon]